jgi:ketosteroid isomerase-like protein
MLSQYVVVCAQQPTDEAAIKQVLINQQAAWNNGDIRGFMQGYWQNDSLQFLSPKGIKYGWQPVLDNYLQSYPDTATMGQLQLDIITLYMMPPLHASVTGKWNLSRNTLPDVGGHFTLLFKKTNNGWRIIADHTH